MNFGFSFLVFIISYASTIHILLPFSKPEDLKPCNQIIDYPVEYNKALTCSEKVLGKKIILEMPTCFVVSPTSMDVHTKDETRFVTFGFDILQEIAIVGFYEQKTKTIFVIEQKDLKNTAKILRHELQHYFLHMITGDGNGEHTHPIWFTCQGPYYVG